MPSISSVTDLFEALGRDPQELVGLAESEWLDFKKEPYHLDDEKQCFQLAKDVTAIANTDEQGVIVIGVETVQDPDLKEEVASELRPVGQGWVYPKRIQDTVYAWAYPRLDVAVKPHAIANAVGDLWTILVGRQRDRDLPFMVAREFVGGGRSDRNLFGVYRRHSSHNVPYTPSQVHQWLQQGSRAAVAEEAVPHLAVESQADAVVQDDMSALGLPEDSAWYCVQAAPTQALTVPRFYPGASGSVFETLTRIPHIRPDGFNLPDGSPERTTWDGLRVAHPGGSSISISRNGVTTAILGQRYLTWATERFTAGNELWINPLALVEFTFEFWRFYVSNVAQPCGGVVGTTWRAGMHNLGDPIPVLLPRRLLGRGHPVQEVSRSVADDFELPPSRTEECDAGRLAFATLVEVYAKFGVGEDLIPCAEGDRLTERQILSVGNR